MNPELMLIDLVGPERAIDAMRDTIHTNEEWFGRVMANDSGQSAVQNTLRRIREIAQERVMLTALKEHPRLDADHILAVERMLERNAESTRIAETHLAKLQQSKGGDES